MGLKFRGLIKIKVLTIIIFDLCIIFYKTQINFQLHSTPSFFNHISCHIILPKMSCTASENNLYVCKHVNTI